MTRIRSVWVVFISLLDTYYFIDTPSPFRSGFNGDEKVEKGIKDLAFLQAAAHCVDRDREIATRQSTKFVVPGLLPLLFSNRCHFARSYRRGLVRKIPPHVGKYVGHVGVA